MSLLKNRARRGSREWEGVAERLVRGVVKGSPAGGGPSYT